MAKGSIFERADALRRGGGPGTTSDDVVNRPTKTTTRRSVVRRKKDSPAVDAAPAAPEAPEAPRTTVRRRTPRPVEVDEASSPPVLQEAVVPPAGAEEPESAPAPEIEAAAPDAPAESTEAADAPEAADDLSLDSLLDSAPKKRVHKLLDESEVAADQARLDGVVEEEAQAPEVPADATEIVVDEAILAAAVAAAVAGGKTPDDQNSLEDLLKQQGIVQHKPKKGRRIIEDEMTAGTAASVKRPPKPEGVSLFEKKAAPRGPVRFLNPEEVARARAPGRKGRGKRKSVVQRQDDLYGHADRRRGRRSRTSGRSAAKTAVTTPAAHKRIVKIHGTVTVGDLAKDMGLKGGVVIKALISQGQMTTVNETLDFDTAQLVAQEFGYEIEDVSFKEDTVIGEAAEEVDAEAMAERAPVVTIMGHVDHGKTTLLDAIRGAKVADNEAGGITQHISAFDVMAKDQRIAFVDTPGHAAFTAMRARGAQMTDIVVLVVAASEGVMPQTEEVISHAKAAEVPIIVALNKIDLPDANIDKCKQQLSERELIPDDWGGEVQMLELSAKTKEGIDELLEAITLQAEMLELKAVPTGNGRGRVVEAQFEQGRGPVAIVLIQRGELEQGQVVVAGCEYGKVRAIYSTESKPKKLKTAGPSTPVAVLGLSGLPLAGDEFVVVESERDAKAIVEHRREEIRLQNADNLRPAVSLEDLYRRMQEGELKELALIVKADVQGSIEALRKVFGEINVRDTEIKIIHSGVGGVTEGDVTLASASGAIIVGFGVRPDGKARKLAESEGVDIRTYRVIYEAADEVRQALVGMLDPEFVEKVQGHAEVREVFKISKLGSIAGCSVQDGKIGRSNSARLLRNSLVVWEGRVGSLRRFKDDVKEVLQGYECGIGLQGYDDIKEGDVIEAYTTEEVRPEA